MASLRRYVAANLPEEVRRSQVRVLRLEPAKPGQEAQIDYKRAVIGLTCRLDALPGHVPIPLWTQNDFRLDSRRRAA